MVDARSLSELHDGTFTMASKITPFLFRSAVRTASRATLRQTRAFSVTARRPSDTLQVVSQTPRR